jgi:hypothetical protein
VIGVVRRQEEVLTLPEHKTAREIAQEMRKGVPEALERAAALVASPLRDEIQPLFRRIEQCREQGEYALWMDTLFWAGACAEELGRDADLPPEFWHRLEFVAEKLQFPEFIPQTRGKAAGLPARGLCDYLAAIVVIHREVGKHWAGCFPDQPSLLDEFLEKFKAVHHEYPGLFESESAAALARRFEADGWLTDPPPEEHFPVRRGTGDVFWPLFAFVNADGFPESLADERWSVVAFNYFRLKPGDGLFPRTVAKPWWMG